MRPDITRHRAGAPEPAPGASGARCPACGGTGFRVLRHRSSGRSYAGRCSCRREERALDLLRRARIPSRYSACDFGSFFRGPEFHPSIEKACLATRDFVENYTARRAREVAHYTARVAAERESQRMPDDLAADAARLGAPEVRGPAQVS